MMSYWVVGVIGGILVLGMAAWTGCRIMAVMGNGQMRTEKRPCADGVREIRIEGSWQVVVHANADEERCEIRTDANLFDYLQVHYQDGVLRASTSRNLIPTDGIRLTIYARGGVALISRTGSGGMRMEQLHTDDLMVNLAGSGDFELVDSVLKKLTLNKSGSGDVRVANTDIGDVAVKVSGSGAIALSGNFDLVSLVKSGSGDIVVSQARRIELVKSGSGNAALTAMESISGAASGSGDIRCYGTDQVSLQKQGSGKLHIEKR